jgi:hypothetical protein
MSRNALYKASQYFVRMSTGFNNFFLFLHVFVNLLKYGKTVSTDSTKAKIKKLLQSVAINHPVWVHSSYIGVTEQNSQDDFSLDAWCTIGCTMPDTELYALLSWISMICK